MGINSINPSPQVHRSGLWLRPALWVLPFQETWIGRMFPRVFVPGIDSCPCPVQSFHTNWNSCGFSWSRLPANEQGPTLILFSKPSRVCKAASHWSQLKLGCRRSWFTCSDIPHCSAVGRHASKLNWVELDLDIFSPHMYYRIALKI